MPERSMRAQLRVIAVAVAAALVLPLLGIVTPGPVAAASGFTLVRTINTAAWSPSSPDPAGVTYDPSTGRLIVTDSEVDEMAIFAGKNAWETSLTGAVQRSFVTTGYTTEPAGAAINPANGRLFIAQDEGAEIFEINPGGDGRFGTGDDTVRQFDTAGFGSTDPSGITFAAGDLFIADDAGTEIWRLKPGPNGRFDGANPGSDDTATHFDVGNRGQLGPEGIGYNARTNTLYIVSNKITSDILEVTLAGATVRVLDLASVPIRAPGGLAVAPSSGNPNQLSIYLADRGVDNAADPNENDGRIFELALPVTPFTDIANSPFKSDIEWLFTSGITTGCTATRFCPTASVTREQMASFLVRAFNLPATNRDFFTDDERSVHETNINRLAASGITTGCTATRFCPTAVVTREQMASFLSRALNLPATNRDFFTDDERSIHEQNINRLAASGVTTGCTATRFCPGNVVTREQMAAFLRRAKAL